MKATKSQIYDFIKCAKLYSKYNPNWNAMIAHLNWPRNTFWHVKLACESLGLITAGRGGPNIKIELTRNGELLKSALEKSKRETDDVLAKVLLSLDARGWKIIDTLVSLADAPEGFVSFDTLRSALAKKGVQLSQTTIADLLNLFRELQIVRLKQSRDVRLLMRRYEHLSGKKLYNEPSPRKFFNAVLLAYESLLPRSHGSRYVAIPAIKSIVCKKKVLDIPEYIFDDKLETLPLRVSGRRIDLSPPMNRKRGGIKRGKDYFYYMAIYD